MLVSQEHKLIHFIGNFTKTKSDDLNVHLDLVKDLQLNGEKAIKFIEEFAEKFEVDMTNFDFHLYFQDEVSILTNRAVKLVPIFFISAFLSVFQIEQILTFDEVSWEQFFNNPNMIFPASYIWSLFVVFQSLNPSDFSIWFIFLLLNFPFAYILVSVIGKFLAKKKKKIPIKIEDLIKIAESKTWNL